jgi:hypothetical protein
MTRKWIIVNLILLLPLSAQSLLEPMDVIFDLGTRRRNWTHAKWTVVDLSNYAALANATGVRITVTTANPRRDAGVTLALRESDGTWYSHPWASDLSAETNSAFVRFQNFSPPAYHNPPQGSFKDENDRLDSGAIDKLAIGVVNPLGVGEVSFRVEAVEPVTERREPLETVPVEVTGRLISVNGTDTLPVGIFGAYNLKSVDGKPRTERYRLGMDRRMEYNKYSNRTVYGNDITPIMINAVGDRTQASAWMDDASWRDKYRKAGLELGAAAKAAGRKVYLEFWNEPYLNWANDNRIHFDPKFYDMTKAEEGGPVHLKTTGEVLPHLKWTKDFDAPPWNWTRAGRREWRRGRTADGKWSISEHARPYKTPHYKWRQMVNELNPPDEVADGETYEAKGKTYTAFTPWHIYDETQFTYWSGRGMLKPYIEPLEVYATALKEAGGKFVEVIVGWGNRPSEDHWAAFDMLYKPTIDAAVGVIDAYNDHDYGSDPRLMPANYEVVTGYGQAEHGKWLHAYNTETASNADPQAVGEVKVSGDAFKFQWVSRKIAAVLDFSVGKCRGLAHFGVGGGFWSDSGEGVAMDLMRNLRGRLVETRDPLSDLYVTSTIDGTDPMAPRPDDLPDRQELVTLLLNDGPEARTVQLNVRPPEGARFTDGMFRKGVIDWEAGKPSMEEAEVPVNPDSYAAEVRLEPGIPYVLTLGLDGEIDAGAPASVTRTQTFANAFLQDVTPDAPLTVSIPVENASGASRPVLRIVADHIRPGEAEVDINGVTVPLPEVVSPENHSLVVQVPLLDAVPIRESNELVFRITDPAQAGFLLGSASLIVETSN